MKTTPAWLLSLVSFLLRLWWKTLRLRPTPAAKKDFGGDGPPQVILLWHNQLFTAPLIYKKFRSHRQLAAMVSASSDGEILTRILNSVGMTTLRGSTGRDGVKALTQAVRHLRSGKGDVAITPDGSRGPCYHFNPGPLLLVDKLKTPMLLASLTTPGPLRLKSWDRFQIPLPFSRIFVNTTIIQPDELPPEFEEKAAFLRTKLLQLSNLTSE